MNRKHERFKRLFALFLVLVMLATSGNGYPVQVLASGIDETQQTDPATATGTATPTDTATATGTATPTDTATATGTAAPTDTTAPTGTKQSDSPAQEDTKQSDSPAPEDTKQSDSPATEDTKQSDSPATEDTKQSDSPATEDTKPSDSQTTAGPQDQSTPGGQNDTNIQGALQAVEAANGVMMLDAGESKVFELEASIDQVGQRSKEISSGNTFDYIISYTVLPLEGGANYTSMTIQIPLADNMEVVEDPAGINRLAVTGEDVQSVSLRRNTNTLYITLKTTLTTGQARRITIKFKTSNFKWPDGSPIQLEPTLSGKISTGADVTGELKSGSEASVTVRASDGWSIDKSVGEVTSDDDFYYVPYILKLQNTTSDGTAADTDRKGRLEAAKPIVVTDVLPKADSGAVNGNGAHIGYPSGGAAADITDVKMDGEPMTEGTDYTYDPGDGEIIFNKTAVATADGAYIPAGSPENTTYTYTVKYPKTPYLSPSNDPNVEQYQLLNTAKLGYTLLGQAPKEDSDTAEIVLGEKSENAGFQNLTVKKVVEIDGEEYAFDTQRYGTVSFELYNDKDCKEIAWDFQGQQQAGAKQAIGDDGTVTFYRLLPGTYYLKELQMGDGLSNGDPVVQVTLNEDGTVEVGEGETTAEAEDSLVKVKNKADAYGNVEFYKYGKNSEGSTGSLAGVTFTLTSKTDGSKVYTAVSGTDGCVFFEGIPKGDYTLQETAVADSDYEVDSGTWDVTVEGNKTNYPQNLPNEDSIKDVDGVPVFENISSKGKFQFRKVDSKDESISLKGAQFKLYGPFDTALNEIPEGSTPVQNGGQDYILTSGSDTVTSIALEAGYYIMEEVSAPEGYAIIGNGTTPVQVIANQVNSNVYVIKNDAKVRLIINKTGTIQNDKGNAIMTEELAGAVFKIYDQASGGQPIATIETYLDGTGKSVSGIKNDDGTFDDLYLAPGTYYYEEVTAPDGYEVADSERHEIELNAENMEFKVENSAEYGEILITKVDSKNPDKKLGGAIFGVYTDPTCQNPLKGSDGASVVVITNSDGTGKVRVPAPPTEKITYYLKETKAPDNYVLSEQVIEVDVQKNHQTQVEPIKNDELRSIVITKKDSVLSNKLLKDASFELYGPYDNASLTDEEIASLNVGSGTYMGKRTTEADGICRFDGLLPGKVYYVKEVEAPEGYVLNGQAAAVTTTGADSETLEVNQGFTNDREGKIVINKTTTMDAPDGKPFSGIEFTLFKAIKENNDWKPVGEAIASATTANNGQAVFDGLEPGDYVVAEMVPEGYENAGQKVYTYVKVTAGMNQEGYNPDIPTNITNTAVKGKLELDKVSSANPEVHVKAVFEIYKDDGSGKPAGDPLEEIKTTGQKDTFAVSGWLDPGKYVLVEKETAEGYALKEDPIPFEIKAGETTSLTGTQAVENDPQGSVTFHKKAVFAISKDPNGANAAYDLAGAVLRLYKKTSDDPVKDITKDNYDDPAVEIDMSQSATGTSGLLDPGDYWIVESTFPEEYYADTQNAQKITIDGKPVWVVGSCTVKPGETSGEAIEIDNYTNKGKLRINKKEFGTEKLLDGVDFETYKVCPEGTDGAIQTPNGAWVVKVSISASSDAGGEIMESGTNGPGSALSIDIDEGTYYIKEVDDSKLEQDTHTQWYPYDGEWRGPITVEEGKETIVDFYNYTMEGPGTKVDELTKEPLEGAVFAAFEEMDKANAFVSELKALQVSINAEAREELRKHLKEESYLTKWEIADVSTPSDGKGEFKFDALKPKQAYYIVEAVPAEGYALNYSIYKVVVADDGDGFASVNGQENGVLNVEDPPLGQISVKKITELSGKEYTVSGIEFNVYPAVKDTNGSYIYKENGGTETKYSKGSNTPLATGTTNASGIYTTILLEAGWYIIEETVPADSIVTEPTEKAATYRVIEIEAGHKLSDGSDATFENPAKYGKFLLKKVDDQGNLITNTEVTFQLYRKVRSQGEETWEKVGEPFEAPKTGDGIYESDFLEAGDYKLVELSAPGYTVAYGEDTPICFKIESGKLTGSSAGNQTPTVGVNPDQPLILTNDRQGSLEVLKVGMFSGEVCDANLQGVEFTLYSDKDCTEPVGVKTTGTDGKCSWTNLDAGDYWLKETGILTGSEADGKYTLSNAVRKVTINKGGKTALTSADDGDTKRFENNTTYGKFEIKKADANDTSKGLAGAVFEIYSDEDCTNRAKDINGKDASITTGVDGSGVSPLLPAGDYYLKEVKAPEGYAIDKEITGPYAVTANKTTPAAEAITDTKLFSIVVTKMVTETDTALQGARIGLYESKEAAESGSEKDCIAVSTSDKDGRVVFSGLKFEKAAKTYYIRELEAPEGYDLNSKVYEVTVSYEQNKTEFTFADDGGVLYNDRLGTVTIHKQGSWQNIDQAAQVPVNLEGVIFSLYKVDKKGASHTPGATPDATMTTNDQGMATSKGLPAGWYELVETGVPEGYAKSENYWVEIENNVDSTDLYTKDGKKDNNTITNTPNKGKFTLFKYDGQAGMDEQKLTALTGATFLLEKRGSDGFWAAVNPDNPTFTIGSAGGENSYTSAYLEPGYYRITEQDAPVYTYVDSTGTHQTIKFALTETPIEFEIKAGVTLKCSAYNSPKGSITLTKYGEDPALPLGKTETLSGATFKLYKDVQCTQEVAGSLRITNEQGVASWTELDPGTYWVKETDDGKDALNDKGYGLSDEVKEVTVKAGALISEVIDGSMDTKITFIDPSNAGKIRILKTDATGLRPLAGAVFDIYAEAADGWSDQPVQTLMITDAKEGAVSGFLPAEAGGTAYKIVERRAPDGYTLDSALSEIEKIVTVYPYHTPAESADMDGNCFTFSNRKDDSMAGLNGNIHKQIREAGADDDETVFTDDAVTAEDSLLLEDYTLEYKLDGYGDGKNDKPVQNLTVTDNNIVLQYAQKVNDSSEVYKDLAASDKDYTINSVTVKASSNGDRSQKAGAVVYAQYTMAEKSNGTWHEVKVFNDLSSDQTLRFDRRTVGVKVVYTNTLEKFKSDGLILNVTFDSRGAWSTQKDPEVRRITNSAGITWQDTYLDASGQLQTRDRAANTNEVVANIPSFENKIPEIQITTEITDNKTTFYSGDEINFRITAENMSSDDPQKVLHQPILSFKLPAQTTLDETQWSQGFLITKIAADGKRYVIPSSLYTISKTETAAAEGYEGGNTYEESGKFKTTQYAIEFADDEMTDLEPGDKITIEFGGYISYEQKTGFDLVIPAYLSSGAKIPVSAENPKGLSFVGYKQQLYDNDVADGLVNDDLQYVNDTDTRYVTNTNAVQMLKEIGTKEADGNIHWYTRGEVAKVHPSEEIYYRLTLYNYSDTYIEKAKLVDIFPCQNDTYVLSSSEARGTDIPLGPGYEPMQLIDASADARGNVTWYSTTHDWSSRSDHERTTILQPMYYKASDWSQGWSAGINANATALGMEIDFTNGGASQGLEASGIYQVVITMKTPGYTADKIGEYYGKYMDNSAAVSVVKQGTSDLVPEIALEDQAEPNKVRATMDLPTGSIGDYVWFDQDLDGIQDEDEEPVQGMTVELWQTRHYEFNGSVRHTTEKIASTQTDQDGRYLFTGLACQYLNSGAAQGSEDPSDYVGGEYYTYQVKFLNTGKYEGYAFTQRYAGNDKAVDSDADSAGESGDIILEIISNADGSLSGETDLTIDAGITGAYALGDYVWLDTNNNGVQDDSEQGVPGVPVFLYRVDGPDSPVKDGQNYAQRTTTDENGYYLFDNLAEGYYVVEFDVSNLKKLNDTGYTYQYDFTKTQDVSAGRSGTDSDARYSVDEDGRIKRTDVITLTKEALEADGIYDRQDMRWDAGLVVYSAIGGFVFDDQDYDDLQSIKLPLAGTVVELYEVNADGTLSETPIAAQTVGDDGRYYFDHLVFDTEYKDYSIKFIYPEGYYGVEANADGDQGTSDPAKDSARDSDVNLFERNEQAGGIDRSQGYIRRIRLGQDMVTTTWDAGARKYSTIGDYVWIDENKDGIQDAGETPVAGAIVVLQSRPDDHSQWEYEAYTTTDKNGYYQFEQLESSAYITKEYRVVFVFPENTQITTLNSGSNSALDSDAIGTYMADIIPIVAPGQTHKGGFVTTFIKPGYGETDLTWDAGIIQVYGAIGDYVWYDDDHDGIQDDDEKGVPGVSVILEMNTSGNSRDEDAWVVIGETTTDENGYYIFEDLNAGYYRVKFQIPEDYVNTRYNRGTGEHGNEVDSDASRNAGDGWYYSSTFYLSQGQRDMTWDAGIYKPKTRTETTINRRPNDREVYERVTRVRQVRRNRNVKTGDEMNIHFYAGIAIVSMGAIITVIALRQRKRRKEKNS